MTTKAREKLLDELDEMLREVAAKSCGVHAANQFRARRDALREVRAAAAQQEPPDVAIKSHVFIERVAPLLSALLFNSGESGELVTELRELQALATEILRETTSDEF